MTWSLEREYSGRLARVVDSMRHNGVDFLVLPVSVNQAYVSGLALKKSERLTAVVVSSKGTAWVLFPAFETSRIDQQLVLSDASRLDWKEDEDPYARLAAGIPLRGKPTIGLEGTGWFSEYRRLAEAIPAASFVSADPILGPLRERKSPWEITCIEQAISTIDDARDAVLAGVSEGTSEMDACEALRREAISRGGDNPSPHGFHVGRNSGIPHGGKEDLSIRRGSVILVDAGVFVNGYKSDITRTTSFGAPPAGFEEVFSVVLEAQKAALAAVRPGIISGSLDRLAREVIEQAGLGERFPHRLGHGLGLQVHEPPWIGPGELRPLEEGMVFTVEPGVYFDGRYGIRIEDNVAVTQDGCRILSKPITEFVTIG